METMGEDKLREQNQRIAPASTLNACAGERSIAERHGLTTQLISTRVYVGVWLRSLFAIDDLKVAL